MHDSLRHLLADRTHSREEQSLLSEISDNTPCFRTFRRAAWIFHSFFSDADERATTIHVMFSGSRRGFTVNNALGLRKVIREKAVK